MLNVIKELTAWLCAIAAALLCLALLGCTPKPAHGDLQAEAAAIVATCVPRTPPLVPDGPRPPAPTPDETGAVQGFLGITDTLESVKRAADRATRLIDDARRDGQITVEVKLPKQAEPFLSAQAPGGCAEGVCPIRPLSAPPQTITAASDGRVVRGGGSLRRVLFRRWRRYR